MSDEVKELNGVEQPPETVVEEKPTYVWRPQDADREYIKAYTRNRVRNSHVSENAVFIPAKPKPTIPQLMFSIKSTSFSFVILARL